MYNVYFQQSLYFSNVPYWESYASLHGIIIQIALELRPGDSPLMHKQQSRLWSLILVSMGLLVPAHHAS